MATDKINQVRGKLASAQILLEQVRNEYAASATLLPTGELATGKDEVQKLLDLHKMTFYDAIIKLLDVVKENL